MEEINRRGAKKAVTRVKELEATVEVGLLKKQIASKSSASTIGGHTVRSQGKHNDVKEKSIGRCAYKRNKV